MALRRHIGLARVSISTEFASEQCDPAFSIGHIYDCPTDELLEQPGTTVFTITISFDKGVSILKTCPTCGAETTVLILNVANGQHFCHSCSGQVCPSFMPHYVFTAEDVAWLRACGIDPEVSSINGKLKKLS